VRIGHLVLDQVLAALDVQQAVAQSVQFFTLMGVT